MLRNGPLGPTNAQKSNGSGTNAATHLEASDYTQVQLYYRAPPQPMQQQVHAPVLRARPPPSTLATTTSMGFLHVDQTRAKRLPPNAATHLAVGHYTQVQLSGGRGRGGAPVDMRCPVAGPAEMVVVWAEASSHLTGVAATAVVRTAAVGSAKSLAEACRVTTGKALYCTADGAGSRL